MRELLYRLNFAKGPSLFCNGDYVNFLRSNDSTPTYPEDPLYPEMCSSEAIKVVIGAGPNGENVIENDDSLGTNPSNAGILFTIPSLAAVSELEVLVDFKVTAAAIADGLPYSLPFWLSYNLGLSGITAGLYKYTGSLDGGPGLYFDLGLSGIPDPFAGPYAEAYLVGIWAKLRARFTNTVGASIGKIVLDLKRQGETTWTRLITQDFPNSDFQSFDSAAIGFAGMPGQVTNFELWSGFGEPGSENAPLDPCCATSGAPGGGTINPDGSVTPVGPRQGVNSGVAPSYTACAGGGALAAASDPTDPQSLDGITDPILHVVFDAPVDGDQRWGEDSINAGTTSAPIEQRVTRYDEIPSEVLAGRDGVIPTPTFKVTLQDTDRQLRGWSQDASKRFFLGRFAEVLAESYGQRQLDTEARKLAAGYCIDWKFLDELLAEFTFADLLGWKRGALKRRVPLQTVQTTWAPDAPEDSIGRPVPWIYGELHDGYDWTLDPTRLPVGIVGGIPIGKGYTLNMTNLLVPGMGTVDWEAFLIGKVCKAMPDNFYCWNGYNDDAARGRIAVNQSFVTDYLTPEMSGWSSYFSDPFVKIVGTDGVQHDVTAAFLRGPRGYEARVTGRYPPSYNVCGIEDVGDNTGDLILDGATALAHFICYGIFSNHTSGVWGPIPTLPNGAPVINLASLAATKAIFDLRVTGGYPCGFAIGATGRDRRTGEEEITAKGRGLDIQFGRNHFGQIVFDTVNDLADISSLTAFDDSMMVDLSFWCHPRVDQQENIKRYTWGPEPSTGRNTGIEREITDDDAIDNWGEQGGEEVRLNEAVRRKAVADDVAMRELLRDADVPHDGGFVSDLRGTSLSVGQLITITTEWAHWPSTEAHVVKVTGLYPQGNATELLTRVTFEDVHRLMSLPANALAGMLGPAWGQPIGSSVGLTSQPIGSSVAGTARRLS